MFDKIINFLWVTNRFEKYSKNVNFTADEIQRFFIYKEHSFALKIILLGWSSGLSWITKILARRISRKGFSCLVYSLPRTILPHDTNLAPKRFSIIKEFIKQDIANIKSQYNFQKIDIIAVSLGVVSACLIANDNDDIQNLFFIVPGSCLTSSLWNGIKTQKLKNIYERQNINQEQLKISWKSLAPKNNASTMANKNIFIAISKSDKVIPYCFGKELADLVKKLYPNNTIVQENSYLGHYLTAIKYYLFDKELLK